VEIAAARQHPPGGVLELACGHAKPAEIHTGRWLLLPLFQSEGLGKLCEDVRDAEVCVAVVGDILCEVAKPLQREHSGRWTALAAQRPRRSRKALSPSQNNSSLSVRFPTCERPVEAPGLARLH
jgi:hypothetical protein